jgi:hypothetical protein
VRAFWKGDNLGGVLLVVAFDLLLLLFADIFFSGECVVMDVGGTGRILTPGGIVFCLTDVVDVKLDRGYEDFVCKVLAFIPQGCCGVPSHSRFIMSVCSSHTPNMPHKIPVSREILHEPTKRGPFWV